MFLKPPDFCLNFPIHYRTRVSKSTVSSPATGLLAWVNHWKNRRLKGPYPFLLLDALVIRVRKDDSVVPVAALIATGISEDGQREILGLTLCQEEKSLSDFQDFVCPLFSIRKLPDFPYLS